MRGTHLGDTTTLHFLAQKPVERVSSHDAVDVVVAQLATEHGSFMFIAAKVGHCRPVVTWPPPIITSPVCTHQAAPITLSVIQRAMPRLAHMSGLVVDRNSPTLKVSPSPWKIRSLLVWSVESSVRARCYSQPATTSPNRDSPEARILVAILNVQCRLLSAV